VQDIFQVLKARAVVSSFQSSRFLERMYDFREGMAIPRMANFRKKRLTNYPGKVINVSTIGRGCSSNHDLLIYWIGEPPK